MGDIVVLTRPCNAKEIGFIECGKFVVKSNVVGNTNQSVIL